MKVNIQNLMRHFNMDIIMSIEIIDAFIVEKNATLKAVTAHLKVPGISFTTANALTINVYELKAQIKVLKEVRKQIELST